MAKLPAPGEMVQIRPAPAHLPNVTCLARVLSATAESLLVERDNGTRQVVLSDNWVPAPTEPDPGPLARHMEARATDPTVKRTDDNLRQVFGPTEPAKKAPKAKDPFETVVLAKGPALPGNPGPGEHCDHGQPIEALAEICHETVYGLCDGGSVGVYGYQVHVEKDLKDRALKVWAVPNAGRMGKHPKWAMSLSQWESHIGRSNRAAQSWASRVVKCIQRYQPQEQPENVQFKMQPVQVTAPADLEKALGIGTVKLEPF